MVLIGQCLVEQLRVSWLADAAGPLTRTAGFEVDRRGGHCRRSIVIAAAHLQGRSGWRSVASDPIELDDRRGSSTTVCPGTGKVDDRNGQVTGIHIAVTVQISLAPSFALATGTGEVHDGRGQVTGVHISIEIRISQADRLARAGCAAGPVTGNVTTSLELCAVQRLTRAVGRGGPRRQVVVKHAIFAEPWNEG